MITMASGDLMDDEEMLDWLTDPNVMEISDQIEKVATSIITTYWHECHLGFFHGIPV